MQKNSISRNITGIDCMVEPLEIAETNELGLSFDSAILASNSTDIDNNNSFYALVIGINDYPNLGRLSGAIADADRVVKFLSTNLQVPLDHIINLRNEEASRAAIIQGFFKLRDDPRIVKGDPIFIYYAGHGGSRREKRNSGAANEVQVIFPYDYGGQEMESDRFINCIPDQTIATLLNSLSEEKGNNITVVFDSCHSASGSRDGSGVFPSMQPRCAPLLHDIPCDLDDDILGAAPARRRKSRSVEPILCTDQGSHVLLAACGSREKAWEQDQQGRFTTALLEVLQSCPVEKLTYHNLIISLPDLINQSPHCYGANKSRVIFNSRISSSQNAYIPVTFEREALTLGAGTSSGITSGSIWELHLSVAYDSQPFGRFTAKGPRVSTTTLTPFTEEDKRSLELILAQKSRLQLRLYARQLNAGTGNELKVWFSPQAARMLFHDSDRETSQISMPSKHEVGYIHHSREGADLEVEIHNIDSAPESLEVAFSICDSIAQAHGVSKLEQRKPAQRRNVESVLFAAAKWNWHLRRINEQHIKEGRHSVIEMGMYKVGQSIRANRRELFQDPESVPVTYDETGTAALVEFVARSRDLYGIKLSNKRSVPLYVSMFFFDATDFSIVHLFGHSASNGQGDPELPADGELFIGDAVDGGSPLKFTIPLTKKVEVGHLKIFWSTDPLELDHVPQPSAFDSRSSRGVTKVSKHRVMKDWGTVCLTLVQHSPSER